MYREFGRRLCAASTARTRGGVRHDLRHVLQDSGVLVPVPTSSAGGRKRAAERSRRKAPTASEVKIGAGNGIRTRDFDLGKVALYH